MDQFKLSLIHYKDEGGEDEPEDGGSGSGSGPGPTNP